MFSFFIALTSWGTNYDGIITKLDRATTIRLNSTGQTLTVISASQEIEKQINRLKTSDFISLEGFSNVALGTITAQSVNYVGLKDLIGNWTGNDEFCYLFSNFSTIEIYRQTKQGKCVFNVTHFAREFSYTINPGTPNWLMLLSDTQDSYLMDLVLVSRNRIDLSLYDPDSGDILKEIKLRH